MTPTVTVVSPLYRSREEVGDLVDRLRSTLDRLDTLWEIVLIDDCCPEESGRSAARHTTPGEPIRVLRLSHNVGQVAAVLIGLGHARGDLVVVMDADLQDRPEDVPILLERLAVGDAQVASAGRSGRYTSRGRRLSASMFRAARTVLTLGRVPPDAGLFLAAPRGVIDRVLALDDPGIHLMSGLARVGASIVSVPLDRAARTIGGSAYSRRRRIGVAVDALAAVTPFYRIIRSNRRWRWSEPSRLWLTEEHDVIGRGR